MIVYDPLWHTLQRKGISTYQLIHRHGFSSHTIYRLKHNSGISTALIDELCAILECEVEDILQYVPAETQYYNR